MQCNDIEKHSIYNAGKPVVGERLIRTLKNKIYKYMTSVSKNRYNDKLDDIVNKYNNEYHSTFKMKPVDVKWYKYIDFNKGNNEEDPKFDIANHKRTSKYKNSFGKCYTANWFGEVIMNKKVKKIVSWIHVY